MNECHQFHELTFENWSCLPQNRHVKGEALETAKILINGGVKPATLFFNLLGSRSIHYFFSSANINEHINKISQRCRARLKADRTLLKRTQTDRTLLNVAQTDRTLLSVAHTDRTLFLGRVVLYNSHKHTGVLTARDISNLKQKLQKEARGNKTEDQLLIDALNDLIEADPDATIVVGKDEAAETESSDDPEVETIDPAKLKYIFIMTTKMKNLVSKYGKVILMDHTYKINKNRLPLCVIMVTNGNGCGRPVGFAFVVNEQEDTVTSVLKDFRNAIGETVANEVTTVIVDKDPSEIAAISNIFPNALIQLCSFHVTKIFKEKTKK
ncbi:Protein FAR1-RELATED SEQUENCE 5 [Frankliniella fusca]|uniref:Protein FAR1-RELATED SEQUENCE 5 n=1 Tax=Frankliniella fusca TaxID=407009 RepID=A0AAE1H199_9NEOP|nr:Protein FAR1-RELATED SEQUENCE 5 [Frankliniella fusca]